MKPEPAVMDSQPGSPGLRVRGQIFGRQARRFGKGKPLEFVNGQSPDSRVESPATGLFAESGERKNGRLFHGFGFEFKERSGVP